MLHPILSGRRNFKPPGRLQPRRQFRRGSGFVQSPHKSASRAFGIRSSARPWCQDALSKPTLPNRSEVAIDLNAQNPPAAVRLLRAIQKRGFGMPSSRWLRPASQFNEARCLCQSRHAGESGRHHHRCPEDSQRCDHHCDNRDKGFGHQGSPGSCLCAHASIRTLVLELLYELRYRQSASK